MGCWNETCGLTNLPIEGGDKAVLIILRDGMRSGESSSGGFTSPVAVWAPLVLPLFGTYGGLGTITLSAKDRPVHWTATSAVLAHQQLRWCEHASPFEEKETQPLPITYGEQMLEPVERGWVIGRRVVRVHPQQSRHFPVGQMLVRRDAWDMLLGMKTDWFLGECSREENHKDVATLMKSVLGTVPETGDLHAFGMWDFTIETQFRTDGGRSSFFSSLFAQAESGQCFAQYRGWLLSQMYERKIEPALVEAVLGDLADVAHVNRMMMFLRRAWRPQAAKGSVESDWELHGEFARKVLDLVKKNDPKPGS